MLNRDFYLQQIAVGHIAVIKEETKTPYLRIDSERLLAIEKGISITRPLVRYATHFTPIGHFKETVVVIRMNIREQRIKDGVLNPS